MGRLFHPDSPLMKFLSAVGELILLNVLWLVCCVPIITIGPSCTAMCYVVRKIAAKEAPNVPKAFFQALKENFRCSLTVFLILLIPLLLAAGYLLMGASGGLDHIPVVKYLSWVAVGIIGMVCSYVYPLMAHFDNTPGNTLKNAFLLPFANPFVALVATVLNLLPVLTMLINEDLFIRLSFFWVGLGCALTALINELLLAPVFRRFAPEEPKTADE